MNIINLNNSKMMFILLLIMSTLFAISSNSWISCWMGLEMNLLFFIPLMAPKIKKYLMSEASLKYFLVQSLSSINLMFFLILFMMNNKLNLNMFMSMIMNLTLLMKMGAAPFHFWFPNIMNGLNWMNCFILSTWQKIAPMIIFSYCFLNKIIIMTMILSALIGSIGGLNQTSIRKILSYSSINHISWMMASLMINYKLWIMYFSIYMVLNMLLMMLFNLMNSYFIKQLFLTKINWFIKFILMINLLSLGGIPPLLGFLPKWTLIFYLINMKLYFITFILMMTTLINLYYYIQLMYSMFMLNFMNIKFYNFKFLNIKFFIVSKLSIIINILLMMVTILFMLI
uniref:NADH-ubiquinone oxidoreductase chain 2 n=1 Tax=Glossosoma caudatum TaxID=2904899 RepID=A0A9E8LNG8_9NEOP|nr:NADH dehydrogenase subunit 2 [Glossosoma caudatum]UZZ43623.1 NADH dehydrogenase subunit 2 [Glossosoma caudatum]